MRTELKHISNAGDRNRSIVWPQRPLLDRSRDIGNDDLVDLVDREARDLDGRLFEDQFLEFDLELVEIPFAFFCEPVDGEPQHTLLLLVQMADLNAGDAIEPVMLGRFEARLTVEHDVLLADEDRVTEAELGHRRCNLSHMGQVKLADLFGRRPKPIEW